METVCAPCRPIVRRCVPGLDRTTGTLAAMEAPSRTRWIGPAAAALVARPGLWATALRQVRVLAAPGWWRRRPWLPLPDPDYLRFRLVTQYGDPEHAPEPADVIAYLHWCRSYRAALR